MVAIVEGSDTGLPVHPFYKLVQENKDPIQGNFEKFIINRSGTKVVRYCNSDLLDLAYDAGVRTIDSKTALENIEKTIEDLKDFDTRIVDTEPSKFEYEFIPKVLK